MTTTLWFDLAAALILAEHTHAAPEKIPNLTEHVEDRPCPGALVWVVDTGTYLMSGGAPNLRSDPDDPASNIVVYADGWGPDSDRRALGDTAVGHDDFIEHLHLHDGEQPLLECMRRAVADGRRWLVLEVTEMGVAIVLAYERPGPR